MPPCRLARGQRFSSAAMSKPFGGIARCPRCPPGACQRRLLPLPVSVMLIFGCFLVQVGDFYFFTALANKPPLKGEGDQRSWWRGSSVQYNFWGSRIETVRRNSLVPRCPPGACQRRLPIAAPDMLGFMAESLGTCRGRCPHRPADLPEDSNFLGQSYRNRPAEFARCTRCPPRACQRR